MKLIPHSATCVSHIIFTYRIIKPALVNAIEYEQFNKLLDEQRISGGNTEISNYHPRGYKQNQGVQQTMKFAEIAAAENAMILNCIKLACSLHVFCESWTNESRVVELLIASLNLEKRVRVPKERTVGISSQY